MSNSVYCIKCFKKVLYESETPSLCPYCGHKFASSSIASILKTVPTTPVNHEPDEDTTPIVKTPLRRSVAQRTLPSRRVLEEEIDENEYIEVPTVAKLEMEPLPQNLRNRQTIKQLKDSPADTGFTRPQESSSKKKMTKKDFDTFNKDFFGYCDPRNTKIVESGGGE